MRLDQRDDLLDVAVLAVFEQVVGPFELGEQAHVARVAVAAQGLRVQVADAGELVAELALAEGVVLDFGRDRLDFFGQLGQLLLVFLEVAVLVLEAGVLLLDFAAELGLLDLQLFVLVRQPLALGQCLGLFVLVFGHLALDAANRLLDLVGEFLGVFDLVFGGDESPLFVLDSPLLLSSPVGQLCPSPLQVLVVLSHDTRQLIPDLREFSDGALVVLPGRFGLDLALDQLGVGAFGALQPGFDSGRLASVEFSLLDLDLEFLAFLPEGEFQFPFFGHSVPQVA